MCVETAMEKCVVGNRDSEGCATTHKSLTTPFLPATVTLEPTAMSAAGRNRVAMQQPCDWDKPYRTRVREEIT